jgi:tRNA G18 (ribose-2'-O)-methylase SpoU
LICLYMIIEKPNKYTIFALEGITKPGTFGILTKTAVACGNVDYFLISRRKTCPPFHPFVIKSSHLSVFQSRIILCTDMFEALHMLKSVDGAHIAAVGTTLNTNKDMKPLFSFTPPEKVLHSFSLSHSHTLNTHSLSHFYFFMFYCFY